MTDDEIIDIRDRLLSIEDRNALDQNILRDCDIALRVVRCSDTAVAEARERLYRYPHEGLTP